MPHNFFSPIPFRGNFIDGRFLLPRGGEPLLSEDPGDLDRPVGRVRSHPPSVDEAVDAARAAFPGWRDTPLSERVRRVRRYQKILVRRREELAWVIARETGKPWSESRTEARGLAEKVDVTLREALPLVAERGFPMEGGVRGVIWRKPRGVAAIIGPFNVPAHIPNGQAVPALLTGNTVVFKPSELTPFTGQLLAECFQAAGFPRGVFNMVQGDGRVGGRLAAHPAVGVVFFTGSAATGDKIRRLCGEDATKLLALEMGGKNAALVLPDAPLEWAAREIVHGAFSTTGQRCSSTSRVFLHRAVARKFLDLLLARTDALRVGYFTDDLSLGPLVRASAVGTFLRAQTDARKAGFETLRPGTVLSLPRRGHYVRPSVHLREGGLRGLRPFHDVKSGAGSYVDEEIFGPDVAVYIVSREEEMIAGNNSSRYGLAAGVFTRSRTAFRRVAGLLENGVIHWNRTTAMTPGRLPFGGVKASGNHWPAGLFVPYACAYPVGTVEKRVR